MGKGNELRIKPETTNFHILRCSVSFFFSGAEPVSLAEGLYRWNIPRRSPLITALLHGNLQMARLLADGLFYTQKETEFLSRFFCSKDMNANEGMPVNDKSHAGSFMKRLIKSSSRSDMYDLYESYCKYSMSSLSLDTESGLGSRFMRRSTSVDALASSKFVGSAYKLSHSKQLSTLASNDTLNDINGNAETPVVKRSHVRRLDQGMVASVFQVEPEQLQNLDQPQARELIEEICHGIPSLQKLCRRHIHRSLRCGGDRAEIIKQLPVWPRIKNYLLFQLPLRHEY